MRGPVLFLDIDGVLNSSRWLERCKAMREAGTPVPTAGLLGGQLDPDAVALLDYVVKRTGCTVVLSTTWRLMGTDAVREALRTAGMTTAGRIVDSTPDLAQQIGPFWQGQERGIEIQDWLDTNPGYGPIAIIDDDDGMGALADRLVQTDFNTGGMGGDHAVRLVAMLRGAP